MVINMPCAFYHQILSNTHQVCLRLKMSQTARNCKEVILPLSGCMEVHQCKGTSSFSTLLYTWVERGTLKKILVKAQSQTH